MGVATLNMSDGILCQYGNFSNETSYEQVKKKSSWMMDEVIHWQPYLLLSTTRDELLSWMINI
jgi:hypothetical protein